MKNPIKIITLFAAIILTVGILTGCGGAEKKDSVEDIRAITTPEITGEAYFKFCLYGDESKFQEIGLPTNEFDSLNKERVTKIKNDIRNIFADGAIAITDEEVEKIFNTQLNAIKKLTVKIEGTQGKNSAVLKVSTTYIDIPAIYSKAEDDATKKVSSSKFKNETQRKSKLKELYINNLVTYLNNAKPSSDIKTKSFPFAKKSFDNNGQSITIWAPDDFGRFKRDINAMTINENS